MRFRVAATALVFLASMTTQNVSAQQQAASAPILQATIEPRRVVVGQPATLRIDVLAPNYMTAPPELPTFQILNAVTRQLTSININDQRNGTSYAGVRFEFAIHPQEPGSYAIADHKVAITYAAEPPTVSQAVLTIPRTTFEAFIPDAASSLQPFVSATRLALEQTVQRSSEQLAAGGSVTRTVTIKAEGTPAMLLPPTVFAAIPGLTLYPAQPQLQDRTDSRTDALSATRVDSATYMLERPGNYVLPAIEVRWWNAREERIERAHADPVSFEVTANPQAASAPAAAEANARRTWHSVIALALDHWRLAALVVLAFASLAWIVPRATRAISTSRRQRREAWRRSESFSFDQLRRTAGSGDAGKTYFAMLAWLQRFEPAAPDHTVKALERAAGDPKLDREVGTIERHLFGPQPATSSGSSHRLLRQIKETRRNLRRRARDASRAGRVEQLNPNGRQAQPSLHRRPARSGQHLGTHQ